ncbi:hypothetical protein Poli38472_002195 [Pythium oligandrum]|uniref:Replication termination factor 2 n=1 Tax=Pythium oligandrum TaxID=41045 RepID=A0A8K1FJL6_PYTOL|nr:hypothetical protein Poli38472_002195 [Pythium oligandrum]|eukprot:TMW63254.1 hypothetical protein Poli38472_002195 [Pythium oligandrum]
MGNDGGVIAVKRKFMRHGNQKAKGEKADQDVQRLEHATTCAISGEPLQEPIVACSLGNLYNKQALLEHLLAKTIPERFQHITSLKDVVTCNVSKVHEKESKAVFHCPVTMLEFTGKQPFVVIPTCGCVVSERSIKEVQTSECLVCAKSMDSANVISLMISEEQYAEKQKEILAKKAEEKQRKKDNKKKRHEGDTDEKKSESKKRRLEKKVDKAAADAPVGGGMSEIAKEAAAAIEKAKQKNQVFASLFAKDKDGEKKSANDLMMAGGMRYTLS